MANHSPSKNLQRRLEKFFSGNCVLRGQDYFDRQGVMAVLSNANGASADVIGSDIYKVSLEWSALSMGQVNAYCSCPHFADGNMCKHLWAFIIQLDEMGVLANQNFGRNLEVAVGNRYVVSEAQIPKAQAKPNWRRVFKNPGNVKKDHSTSPNKNTNDQEVFLVIGPDESSKDKVQLNLFEVAQGSGSNMDLVRPLPLPPNGDIHHPDVKFQAALKTIATLSLGEIARRDRYRRFGYYLDRSVRTLELNSVRSVLPSLIDSGRIYLSKEDYLASRESNLDLSLKNSKFSDLTLKVSDFEEGYALSAEIKILSAEESSTSTGTIGAHDMRLIASPNLYHFKNQIGFVDLNTREQTWFEELLAGPLIVPPEDTAAFLEAILNQQIQFELPPSLNLERTQVLPTVKVDLRYDKQTGRNRYYVDLKFQYGSQSISYWSPIRELPALEEQRIYLRNEVHEKEIFSRLPLQFISVGREREPATLHAQYLHEFVKGALASGIPVVVESKRVQESNDFKMAVTSGVDWFDVDGQAEFSGRWVKAPAILDAIARGESFVPLDDGSIGLINESMKKRLERLVAFAEKSSDGFRFSNSQGLILNSLLEFEKNIDLDAKFTALREKIRSFSGVRPADPTSKFSGELRKYQREGLGWLEFLNEFGFGGILADDMGLGKTIQCLALLEARRSRGLQITPSLLLAPKSVLENWQMEAKKFTPELKVLIYAGVDRDGSKSVFQNYDLIITTYQTMLRDIEMLREINWDSVIIDEAQAIKNPGALISKATKLLPAKFRLAMTGTPIENSIQDLFSISDFVNPGFLKGKKRSSHLKLDDGGREALHRAFKPVVLRRTKDQVLKDLPEKTEQLISVELEPKQQKLYNELKRFYQSQLLQEVKESGVGKSQIQILAALTRLRQVALHPGLVDPNHLKFKSSKLEVALEMLEEVIAEGHRVLVFSQFTSLLGLFKKELEDRKIDYFYLDGKTTKRQQVVNEFKTSDSPVFLMSLKAGGVGLNLVEADYVFLLDPWWNPAVEAQAIDRVHRIGQKRAVNAYRFIAKNTVEEKILELQKTKRGLSEEVLGQQSLPIKSLSAQDIEKLFE